MDDERAGLPRDEATPLERPTDERSEGRTPFVRRSAPWTPARIVTLVVLLALLALVVYLKITGAV